MAYDPDCGAAAQRLNTGKERRFFPHHLAQVELEVKYSQFNSSCGVCLPGHNCQNDPFLQFLKLLQQDDKIIFDPFGFQADSAPLLSIFFEPSRAHGLLQKHFRDAGWQFRVRFPLAFRENFKPIRLEAAAKAGALMALSRTELEHTVGLPRRAYEELTEMNKAYLPAIKTKDFRSSSGCITARNGIYLVLSQENSSTRLMFYLTYDVCQFLNERLGGITQSHTEIEVEYVGCVAPANADTHPIIDNHEIIQGFAHLDMMAAMSGLTRAHINKCAMANTARVAQSSDIRGFSLRQLFNGRQFSPTIAERVVAFSPSPNIFTPKLIEAITVADRHI